MNIIEFAIGEHQDEYRESWSTLDILIDGRDLREYVREVEAPFAAAEGHPNLAGGYLGFHPRWTPHQNATRDRRGG